jgi:hypothetical protein
MGRTHSTTGAFIPADMGRSNGSKIIAIVPKEVIAIKKLVILSIWFSVWLINATLSGN